MATTARRVEEDRHRLAGRLTDVQLRPYRDSDAAATRRVFERAARSTAPADYTPEPVLAWAPVGVDTAGWAAARAAAQTIVAVKGDEVVGFSDLVERTVLDMLTWTRGSVDAVWAPRSSEKLFLCPDGWHGCAGDSCKPHGSSLV